MTGAAAATVLGQILSAVMAVIYLFNTKAVQLEDVYKRQVYYFLNIIKPIKFILS